MLLLKKGLLYTIPEKVGNPRTEGTRRGASDALMTFSLVPSAATFVIAGLSNIPARCPAADAIRLVYEQSGKCKIAIKHFPPDS